MTGGLIQLVAYGAQDIFLTGNPQITFFKVVYRRHTNFSMESIQQTLDGIAEPCSTSTCTISRNGDLMYKMWIRVSNSSYSACACDTSGITPSCDANSCSPIPLVKDTTLHDNVDKQSHNANDIIESIEIQIGGQIIDKQYGDWLNIWSQLTTNASKSSGLSTLLDLDIGKYSYIPLQFWFCRNPGLALPLIALQYHEVKLKITFSKASSTCNLCELTPPVGSWNDARLFIDYIYLDSDERRRFAQVKHEYLIEQLQFTGAEHIKGTSSSHRLNLNHPVKEIIWRANALVDAKNTINNDLDRYKGMNIASGSSPFCVIGELHGMNTNVNTSGTTSMSQLPIYSSTSGFEYRFDTTKLFIDNFEKNGSSVDGFSFRLPFNTDGGYSDITSLQTNESWSVSGNTDTFTIPKGQLFTDKWQEILIIAEFDRDNISTSQIPETAQLFRLTEAATISGGLYSAEEQSYLNMSGMPHIHMKLELLNSSKNLKLLNGTDVATLTVDEYLTQIKHMTFIYTGVDQGTSSGKVKIFQLNDIPSDITANTLKQADVKAVFSISGSTNDTIANYIPKSKILTLDNGIDISVSGDLLLGSKDLSATNNNDIGLHYNKEIYRTDYSTWAINNDNPIDGEKSRAICGHLQWSGITLQLNGHDRFEERHSEYFRLVQPFQHHTRVPISSGIHCYSFALQPEDHQPSGTCNFSRIDNAVLKLNNNSGWVSGMEKEGVIGNTFTPKLYIYAVNYNVLRIMSGMGGLAYSN